MCEVAGVEDGFVVRVAAAEEDAAAGLGAQQHGDDRPGVAVGEGAVHLPQRVADPVRLGRGDMICAVKRSIGFTISFNNYGEGDMMQVQRVQRCSHRVIVSSCWSPCPRS